MNIKLLKYTKVFINLKTVDVRWARGQFLSVMWIWNVLSHLKHTYALMPDLINRGIITLFLGHSIVHLHISSLTNDNLLPMQMTVCPNELNYYWHLIATHVSTLPPTVYSQKRWITFKPIIKHFFKGRHYTSSSIGLHWAKFPC